MKTCIFIDDKHSSDLNSCFLPFFSHEFTDDFFVSSSFLDLEKDFFPIFTDVNKFICKKIQQLKITKYAFILSGDISLDKLSVGELEIIANANFIYMLGEKVDNIFNQFKNVELLPNIKVTNSHCLDRVDSLSTQILIESDSIGYLFEDYQKGKYPKLKKIVILNLLEIDKILWIDKFKKYDIEIIFLPVCTSTLKNILDEYPFYNPLSLNIKAIYKLVNSIGLCDFKDIVERKIIQSVGQLECDSSELNNVINIVCYKPTYLFKDLVDRFVEAGCVHSDFPMTNCKSYIWMRPQEIWHLEFLIAGLEHREISKSYADRAQAVITGMDINFIKSNSVAIHHGTCFEPLYQFDPFLLTKSLFDVKKVVGVCEIEECYSPSYSIANKNNFVFVPIGYDDKLFNLTKINKNTREKYDVLNIGFVGRAYGTNDMSLLNKSKMAEPKGYRKGGDILLNILCQLRLKGVKFKIHIIGQNWDELVNSLESYGINYEYYARDKDVTYQDYPNIYAKCDAILISARCEGGPVSAIESLSLGVPIVSTNVGVVKYLDQIIEDDVHTFQYNKKWHIADIEKALGDLESLYGTSRNYEQRCLLHKQVEHFTTDKWVQDIIFEAER